MDCCCLWPPFSRRLSYSSICHGSFVLVRFLNQAKMDEIDQDIMDEMDEMDIESTTLDENKGYKRQRSDDTGVFQNDGKLKAAQELLTHQIPRRLRLEAIFHPKFDNDKELGDIRQTMISKVSSGLGCLEVSLKHSGSLLLWSGGQRYYSKNSTNNVFTLTGEILLRQHFARAWWTSPPPTMGSTAASVSLQPSDKAMSLDNSSFLQEKYNECSAYVLQNRFTLAFELVTSLLGDHGDNPERDYMILTAVARLDTGTFLTTTEIISFARMFRLPHNDAWLFRTKESVLELLNLYDSFRETGLADFITTSLSSIADGGYFRSMYPHVLFHGNLLEGLVIRYVSNEESPSSHEGASVGGTLPISSSLEHDLLALVPPDRPGIYQLVKGLEGIPPLFTTNLRSFALTATGKQDMVDAAQLLPSLQEILKQTDGRDGRRGVETIGSNILTFIQQMKNTPLDAETDRITKVLLKLDTLGVAKNLKIFYESSLDPLSGVMKKRFICIIHVLHDDSFKKFSRTMSSGDMNLFRGFSIELDFDGDDGLSQKSSVGSSKCIGTSKCQLHLPTVDSTASLHMDKGPMDSTLMLKMKLLPYMVRTFICRNGLSLLTRSGPKGFDQFALQMLNKWGISQSSISLWFPFLSSWGKYAHVLMQDGNESVVKKLEDINGISSIQPLKQAFYLRHLHNFSDLYYSGKLAKMNILTEKHQDFMGLVVILGVNLDEMRTIAHTISRELGFLNIWVDSNHISEENLYDGGYIVATCLDNGPSVSVKTVKDLVGKGHQVFLVLVGCTATEIEQHLYEMKNTKKLLGIASGWRKINCKELIEIPRERLFTTSPSSTISSSEIGQMQTCEELTKLYRTLENNKKSSAEDGVGVFVFFPCIPGSGKSSICEIFKPHLLTCETDCYEELKCREIIVKEADNTKGKYYPQATREKCMNPSSIYVSDKNAPPTAWGTIEQLCVRCGNAAIAIIPDTPALQTTVIEYATSSGRMITEKYPFSLHYLAVCIAQVLKRPRSSHAGKLDVATPNACMIVVKFYWLYKNVTAESFGEQLKGKLGPDVLLSPVKVPFFVEDLAQLPSDLDSLLREAISLQSRVDCDKPKKEEQALLSEMDTKLREATHRYMDYLTNLLVPLGVSRRSAIRQITDQIAVLEANASETAKSISLKPSLSNLNSSDFISYASIDVDAKEVQTIASQMTLQHDVLGQYLEEMKLDESLWIRKTHVTLAHHTRLSQLDLRTRFGSILGRKVMVRVHGILFNKQVAALKVSIGPACMGSPSIPIPAPLNTFVHITLWCFPGVSAVEANHLPMLYSMDQAYDFTLPNGGFIDLIGTVSFVK